MTITLLAKPNCVPCTATQRALDKSGLEYTKRDITEDPEAYELAMSLGYMQAPVVIAGDDHWSGFRPDRLSALSA